MGAASPFVSVRVEHGSQGRHDERCVGRARWLPLLLERLDLSCAAAWLVASFRGERCLAGGWFSRAMPGSPHFAG